MKNTFVLGLTGSIGMGKSTTANIFREAQIAVWDADAAVHELYTSDTDTIEKIFEIAPTSVSVSGVDRKILSGIIQSDKSLLHKIEDIVHPAIREHRSAFVEACNNTDQKLAIVDIPLLYEIEADKWLNAVLVVTIDAETQMKRVMSRAGMNEKIFSMMLSRQIPDAEKRKKADYIIETKSIEYVTNQVHNLIKLLVGSR
ncbi:dephospho-CoA kinase [Amylibacter sp.]|nr:dephospho-CoA kinase [Amylibacter sp.]